MDRVQSSSAWRYVPAANEGDAVAIAAGAELGGTRSAVLMQNSGLGNAVNPLTSLTYTFRIPILVVVSLRGDPEAAPDAHQHRLMGRITTSLLDQMEIPWEFLPPNTDELDEVLCRAATHMEKEKRPFALVVRKKTFTGGGDAPSPPARELQELSSLPLPVAVHYRREFLKSLLEATNLENDVVMASTGYTGRELHACEDRPNHLYMAGSMGCVSSLGLGLALSQSQRRVIVLDGDAALAMRLGALTTIGREAPKSLIHVVFDNGVNESTGGQPSPGAGVDFRSMALAAGYRRAVSVATTDEFLSCLDGPGPALVHVPVLQGAGASPRPILSPEETAQRLRGHLR
jgi:phosphonopyruvate decarboxylase